MTVPKPIFFYQSTEEEFFDKFAERSAHHLFNLLENSDFAKLNRQQRRRILNQKSLAKELGVSQQFLINQRKDNKLSWIPAGNKILFDLDHAIRELKEGRRIDK